MPKNCNPFMLFAKEYMNKPENAGLSLQDSINIVGPVWEQMTQEDRYPYVKMCKSNGTSQCANIEEVNRQARNLHDMDKDLQPNIYKSFSFERKYFFVVHVSNFCYCSTTKRNYPAEIAIARFNLEKGVNVSQVYHKLCKPGQLPLGYLETIKANSANTHQLSIPNSENNMYEIFTDIITILSYGRNSLNALPPLYAEENNFDVVSNVITDLCTDYGFSKDYIKVYSLNSLYCALRKKAGDRNGNNGEEFPSIIENLQFLPNICCEYHEQIDAANFCSKSYVIRYIYIICKNSCTDLHIDLNPNRYMTVTSPDKQLGEDVESDESADVISQCDTSGELDGVTDTINTISLLSNSENGEVPEEKLPSSFNTKERVKEKESVKCEIDSVSSSLSCPCSSSGGQSNGRGGFYEFVGESQKCTGAYPKDRSKY